MPSPARTSPEGVEARKAALRILDAVLRRGQTMDNAAQAARGLPPADAALASAIAGETLRRLPDLDILIDGATRQKLPDDAKARMVLRMALAQKVGLGTPEHALVATALPLVDGGPRRLVHGVLGTLLRRGVPAMEAPRLPEEVEDRWRAAWGDDVVKAARRAIAQRPPLDLSFASDEACAKFEEGKSLAPRHRRLDHHGPVSELPGYDGGCGKPGSPAAEPSSAWWVQDLAASLPARLVPAAPKRVLDACAAPGGKTMQLAAAGHEVTALDRSESRLARLSDNLKRTGLKAQTIIADALEWVPDKRFDAVLLDAPCSATGTFRRHPEVLYRARPSIIAQSAELQGQLLERSAGWVQPGGSLVYAVCSIEPQEGEERIEAFLAARPDFRLAPAPAPFEGVAPHSRGWLRVLPGMLEAEGGLDGFFTAHLVRGA